MKAINVRQGQKYELTYIPVYWTCPKCKDENDITLILEEDLNQDQDNKSTCINCKTEVVIKSEDIFKFE